MLFINKDKGEVIFSYESIQGIIQGRLTYLQPDDHQVNFTLTARTVPFNGELQDISMLLLALGADLFEEASNPIPDANSPEAESHEQSEVVDQSVSDVPPPYTMGRFFKHTSEDTNETE